MTDKTVTASKNNIYYLWYILTVIITVGIDQITKKLAVKYLMPVDTVPIIKDALHLTYVENRGAAFGMLKDSRWVFMSVSTVAIVVIAVFLWKYGRESFPMCFFLSLILGGGIGNMIDRVALGYVVDFIDFRLIDFAVFNGADSFVCVGAFFLICLLTRDIICEYKAEKTEKAANKTNESDEDHESK